MNQSGVGGMGTNRRAPRGPRTTPPPPQQRQGTPVRPTGGALKAPTAENNNCSGISTYVKCARWSK